MIVYNAANPTTPWGWRVPTASDLTTLSTFLGGNSVAGGKMKATGLDYWNSPNTGADNSSGFSAIPNGYRLSNGGFVHVGNFGSLFSFDTRYRCEANSATLGGFTSDKIFGTSIRLIKV